jgi:site-specific recombinase XerD
LAGYSGLTREAYTLDLRQYVSWCSEHRVSVSGARRADIESFGRHLETLGRARATIARRLCTVTCFYRYAEEEGLIPVSPAVHVRRPRLDYESHATGLDRNEVSALLVAAGLAGARDHALISLLALNGLRVSEATGANIEALGLERGHRTLMIHRKGAKIVTIPLAPRTARAIDLAVGERREGPIFLANNGERLDRHAAGRIVRRIACRAGITKRVGPPPCAMRSSPPPSTPAFSCTMSKRPPATPTREPRCATTEPASPSTATPPTSSPPSSPAPPDNHDNLPARDRRTAPERAICGAL